MPTKKSRPNQAVGKAIREARLAQGFTQEAYARKAGLDRSYCGAIERGEFNVTLDTLVSLAKGLGISVQALLDRAKV